MNTVLLVLLHGYLDSYEGLYASMVQGVYTNFAMADYLQDFHTLLFSVYAYINQFFPAYNVYGITLYFLNIASLLFFSYVLYTYFKENILLFLLCYCLVAIDAMLNLSSNRIVITLVVSTYFYLLSQPINTKRIIVSLFIVSFCLLIKAEIVVFLAFIITVGLFFFKKVKKHHIILLGYILFYFFILQVLFAVFFTEARQTFLYNEFDFIDKSNINYAVLSNSLKVEVDAFKLHNIVDKIHFTNEFYSKIEYKNFFFSKQNISESFINTMNVIRTHSEYIILCLVLLILIYQQNKKYILGIIFLLFFVLFVALIINLPDRFFTTYYALLFVFLIKLYTIYTKNNNKMITFLCLLFFALIAIKVPSKINSYKNTEQKVEQFFNAVESKKRNKELLVINNVEYLGRYFAVNPFYKKPKSSLTFLNFWYFNTYNCYINKWNDLCNCNALSLKEKVVFLIENKVAFLTNKADFEHLQYYLAYKYNLKIELFNTKNFNNNLYITNIVYQ